MILRYVLRNLVARVGVALPTALAVVLTIATVTAMLSLLCGIDVAITNGGSPYNIVVAGKGAGEDAADIDEATLAELRALPGVVAVSPEIVTLSTYRNPAGHLEQVHLHGVDGEAARQVHPGVELEGGTIQNAVPGVFVGSLVLRRNPSLANGASLHVGHETWPTLGRINPSHSRYDAELWCDRHALMTALRRDTASVVYMRFDQKNALGSVQEALARRHPMLEAMTESAFQRQMLREVEIYVRGVIAITLLLMIGAIAACTNAFYSAFLGRTRELATLLAIGFTRRRVAMMVCLEALGLAFAGGLIGIAIAMTLDGRTFQYEALSLFYQARLAVSVLVTALLVTFAIGALSGSVATIQTLRLDVLKSLRE